VLVAHLPGGLATVSPGAQVTIGRLGSSRLLRHAGRPRPDFIDRLVLCCIRS
jgi:hypothetical protein